MRPMLNKIICIIGLMTALGLSPVGAWDKTYNTPTVTPTPKSSEASVQLKDGTPDYLSKLTAGPLGPVFLVPNMVFNTQYHPGEIQAQPPKFLKIILIAGKGRFEFPTTQYNTDGTPTPVPMPNPSLKSDEALVPLNFRGGAPILFYPDQPGSYSLQVTCPEHPEAGHLDYNFTTKPLDKGGFDIYLQTLKQTTPVPQNNYRFTRVSCRSTQDLHTHQLTASQPTTFIVEFTKDKVTSKYELQGKQKETISPRHAPDYQKQAAEMGQPWGEDQDNYIFLRIVEGGSPGKNGKGWAQLDHFYNFNYFDKKTLQMTQTITFMSQGSYSINSYEPQKVLGVPGNSTNSFYNSTRDVFSVDKSEILSIKPLP